MAEPTKLSEPDVGEEAALFARALELDEADGVTPSEEAQKTAKDLSAKAEVQKTEPKELEEGQPPQPEAPDGEEKRERGPDGRFLPKKDEKLSEKQPSISDKTPGKAAVPPGIEPQPPAADKDTERYNKNWQKFQQEKEEFRQYAAMEKQRLEKAAIEYQQRMGPARATKEGFTAPDYRKYSDEFFKDAQKQTQGGDLEGALQSQQNAYKALRAAEELESYEYQQQNQGLAQYYDGAFRQDVQRVGQEHPEVFDESNPIVADINNILNTNKELFWMPNGFQKAYEISVLRQMAGEAEAAKAKVAELEAQLNKVNGKLQPTRGGAYTGSHSEKSFKDMTPAEQERHLFDTAAQMDAEGVPATALG
jgi:hypothetical protein